MVNFDDKLEKIKVLEKEISSLKSTIEEELNDYYISLIKKYGSEKDGYIELYLNDLIISSYTREVSALEPEVLGVSLWTRTYYNHIRKLSLSITERFIDDIRPAHVLLSFTGINGLMHHTNASTILVDTFMEKDDGSIGSMSEKLYFTRSFSLEDRIEFAKTITDFLENK